MRIELKLRSKKRDAWTAGLAADADIQLDVCIGRWMTDDDVDVDNDDDDDIVKHGAD